MDTPCPDESVFSRLAAGTLTHAELLRLESHVDQCPACSELLPLLASTVPETCCATSGPDDAGSRVPQQARQPARFALATMLTVQMVAFALMTAPVLNWYETRAWKREALGITLSVAGITLEHRT